MILQTTQHDSKVNFFYGSPPAVSSGGNGSTIQPGAANGIAPGELVVVLDGKVINRFKKPPYWAGTEEYDSDTLLTGSHTLKIKARDGARWMEKTFEIEGE